jgi:predicted permease
MSWTRYFRRRRWDEERARELETYLEIETDENIARGMSPQEARYAAHRKLGNTTLIREEVYRMNSLGWFETLWQDVRFAIRMFVKSPGATSIAVISLAIAIGPNCALFSVVDSLILKPLSVPGAPQMFSLWTCTDKKDQFKGLSYPEFMDYQAQAAEIGSFVADERHNALLTDPSGHRDLVPARSVTGNYFSILGARAVVGRTLGENDAHFEGPPPAVISYSLWQRQFGGAADAVGKTLFMFGRAFSIVGILPRGFREPGMEILPPDVWIPLSADTSSQSTSFMRRDAQHLGTMVKLGDGVDLTRAEAVLKTVAKRLASQYPDTNKGRTIILENPGRGAIGVIVLSLAGLVLLIACANIVGIMMAQGEFRRQEFAVRVAVGASRGRLVRQLIVESLLLSLAAAGVGLLVALWLIRLMPALNPIPILRVDFDFRVDSRVVIYTLAVALVTALAAGLVPSLRASRPDLVSTLKGDAPRVWRRFRLRGALVIGQVAISQFLLVGTGLLVRSYLEVERMRPGFDPGRNVLAAFLGAPAEDKEVDFARLADKLRGLPGVTRVAFTDDLLLSGSGAARHPVVIPGVTSEPVGVGGRTAGAGYFSIMGTRLVRGRDFDRSDSRGTVVVNETMARRIWGSPDAAMGKVFRMDGVDRRVIGVAENGKYFELNEDPIPFVFRAAPLGKGGEGTLLIETAGPPLALAGTVRKAIHDLEPDALIMNLTSLRQSMRLSLFPYRVGAGLIGTIAILGVFLSGVGLYGLVSYSVCRRTHEIGVRVAMGAERSDVLTLVFREVVLRLAIGCLIGFAVALAGAQILRSALYGVSPTDPIGLTAAVAVVAAVGLLAAYAPARRALRVNPVDALREQ